MQFSVLTSIKQQVISSLDTFTHETSLLLIQNYIFPFELVFEHCWNDNYCLPTDEGASEFDHCI